MSRRSRLRRLLKLVRAWRRIIDLKSQFLHQIPLLGRLVRPRTKGVHVRDEEWQARKLVENLSVLDNAGVDGAFIFQFISQITPYSDNPRFDLDMASSSLVKYYDDGKHGATYPDMTWEPKESFRAVADYYVNQLNCAFSGNTNMENE